METSPELFRQQMDYLVEAGYQPVSLAQAEDFLGKTRRPLKKPILLSFDDGYDGVYTYALPELQKRHFKACVFMVVGQIGHKKPNPHLTEAQILEMHRSGVFDFGSHTYDRHILIPEKMAEGKLTDYALWKDLVKSRDVLEKLLGVQVRALAWPYGHYNEHTLRVARRAGFKLVFTTDYGRNEAGSGTFYVRRIRLSSVYDTVDVLRDKLAKGG